jgi:hypothetical protein
MANTTDFLSAVYDELVRLLSVSSTTPSIIMQMAWPGLSLTQQDFKRSEAPNGVLSQSFRTILYAGIYNRQHYNIM